MVDTKNLKRREPGKTPAGLSESRLLERLFFRLLPLQILVVLVGSVTGLVTSFFASNYVNTEAMSAIGLFGPANNLTSTISMMFVGGAQILCAKYMGRNEIDKTQQIFSWDLFIIFILSAASALILIIGVISGVTGRFASEPEVLRMLNQYVCGMAVGIPPLMLGQQLAAFLALENQVKRTTAASVVCVIVTTLASFLLVQVLRLQALGLALAVALGNWSFFLVQLAYFFQKQAALKIRLLREGSRYLIDLVRTGYPGALKDLYIAIRFIIVNALIMRYVGSVGMSSFAASDSVMRLFWTIPTGMGIVARMLLSISIGEEDRKSLADVTRIILYRCIPIMCGIVIMLALLAEPFTRIFFRNPADPVYHMTVMCFRILPTCMPFALISMTIIYYAQACGKKLLVNVLSLVDGILAVAGFSALLIPALGMNGLYIANVLNGVACVLVIVIYAWAVKRQFPRNMDDLMVIPEDFGVPDENRIDLSVYDMEGVLSISREVVDFCRDHGVDEKRTFLSGLFLEEMAGNVYAHGFKKKPATKYIDIRLVLKPAAGSRPGVGQMNKQTGNLAGFHSGDQAWGDIILRIKDNAIPFNPAERKDMLDPDDPVKNIGIRMVYGSAREVQYQNMLGLNVLTILI